MKTDRWTDREKKGKKEFRFNKEMIKKKNEAKCTTEWLREIKKKKWIWLYKIPDVWIAKQPFDIIGTYHWTPVAIEAKFCDTKKDPTFEWWIKKLEPHQVINLDKFMIAWWKSYVLIFHHDSKHYVLFDIAKYCDVWDGYKKKFYILLDKWQN